MPVRQRIGAVVRVDLAFVADRHTRQTGTALRVQPFAAPLDIAVGAQQFFHIVATIEFIDHRRPITRRRWWTLINLRRSRGRLDRPRARRFSITLEDVPALPDVQQVSIQRRQTISGARRRAPDVRLAGAWVNRRWEHILHQPSAQLEHREALVLFSLGACRSIAGRIALVFCRLGLSHQIFVNRSIRVFFIRPRQRMPGQLDAVRHFENHPEPSRITDNGRIHHRHGIQI
ncbi:hypothetical protein D3C85_984830 [compost metagenome]